MLFSNKTYDALKWITLVLLPALSMFYLALAKLWPLPYPTEIVATIAAIDVFLATLLGVSTSNYKVMAASLKFSISDSFGTPNYGWILSKKSYDVLTWIAQLLLPAVATLYYALAVVWHFPYPDQIVATIMAIDTFLGMLLGFSTSQFHKYVALDTIEKPAGMLNLN